MLPDPLPINSLAIKFRRLPALAPPLVRRSRGSSIIESLVAALVILPIALALVDLIALVIANSMNDTACKNAARAAANQSVGSLAFNAANKSISSFRPSGLIQSIRILSFDFANKTAVTVVTEIVVRMPVPVPGYESMKFEAKDVEPIVSQ